MLNFWSYQLSEHEKSLLSKGLNFDISPKILNYAGYILPFQLLFRDINLLDISRTDRDFIQGRLRDHIHHTEMRVKILIRIYRKMNNLLWILLLKTKTLLFKRLIKVIRLLFLTKMITIWKWKRSLVTPLNFINSPLTKIKYLIILSIWKIELFLF